jgi:hypothetical protein
VTAMSERDPLFSWHHDLRRNLCKSLRSLLQDRPRQRQWSASEYIATHVLHQVPEHEIISVSLSRSTLG